MLDNHRRGERSLIVLRYPLSWSVAKKLREGDEVRYYGKIVYVSHRALERMENYYRAEGSFPYDLMGELVFVKDGSPLFIEDVFKMGASGIVKEENLSISKESLKLSKRFKRPVFEAERIDGQESIKLYSDLDDDAVKEIWVDSLKMRVIADSGGEE